MSAARRNIILVVGLAASSACRSDGSRPPDNETEAIERLKQSFPMVLPGTVTRSASGDRSFRHVRVKNGASNPSFDVAVHPDGRVESLDTATREFVDRHREAWGAIDLAAARVLASEHEAKHHFFLVERNTDATVPMAWGLDTLPGMPQGFLVSGTKKDVLRHLAHEPGIQRVLLADPIPGVPAGVQYDEPWIPLDAWIPNSDATSGTSQQFAPYQGNGLAINVDGVLVPQNTTRLGQLELLRYIVLPDGSTQGCRIWEKHEAFDAARSAVRVPIGSPTFHYLHPNPIPCSSDSDCRPAMVCGPASSCREVDINGAAQNVCVDHHATGVASRMIAHQRNGLYIVRWQAPNPTPGKLTVEIDGFTLFVPSPTPGDDIPVGSSASYVFDLLEAAIVGSGLPGTQDLTFRRESDRLEIELASGQLLELEMDSTSSWGSDAFVETCFPGDTFCFDGENVLGGSFMAAEAQLYIAQTARVGGPLGQPQNAVPDLVTAYEWFASEGVRVVNESWVASGPSNDQRGYLQDWYAKHRGLLFVNASGNRGPEGEEAMGPCEEFDPDAPGAAPCTAQCPGQNNLCIGASQLDLDPASSLVPEDRQAQVHLSRSRWMNPAGLEIEMPDAVAQGGRYAHHADVRELPGSVLDVFGDSGEFGRAWTTVEGGGTSLAAPVVTSILGMLTNCQAGFGPLWLRSHVRARLTAAPHRIEQDLIGGAAALPAFLDDPSCAAITGGTIPAFPAPQFCDHKAGTGPIHASNAYRHHVCATPPPGTPPPAPGGGQPQSTGEPIELGGTRIVSRSDPWEPITGGLTAYEASDGFTRASAHALRGSAAKVMLPLEKIEDHQFHFTGKLRARFNLAMENVAPATVTGQTIPAPSPASTCYGASLSSVSHLIPVINYDLGLLGRRSSPGAAQEWIFVSESLHDADEGFDVTLEDYFDVQVMLIAPACVASDPNLPSLEVALGGFVQAVA